MEGKRRYRKAPIDGVTQMRMDYLGQLLREYRQNTLLSMENHAQEYGISRSLIERIERGKVVTVHSLMRYLDSLQVSPEEIFMGVE